MSGGRDPGGARQCPRGAGTGTLPTLSPACFFLVHPLPPCPPCPVPTLSPPACPQAAAAAAGGGQVQQSDTGEGPRPGPRPCRRCRHLRALLEAGAGPVCPVCQGELGGCWPHRGVLWGGHRTWELALHCGPGPSPQTPQVSELEKRLAQLEAAVRCEPDSQVSAQVRGAALPPFLPLCYPHPLSAPSCPTDTVFPHRTHCWWG